MIALTGHSHKLVRRIGLIGPSRSSDSSRFISAVDDLTPFKGRCCMLGVRECTVTREMIVVL